MKCRRTRAEADAPPAGDGSDGGSSGCQGPPRAELKLTLPRKWHKRPLSALLELVVETLNGREPAADGAPPAYNAADLRFYLAHRGAPLAPDALVGDALHDGAEVVAAPPPIPGANSAAAEAAAALIGETTLD